MPRFSIILPCFNAAKTLEKTISSVIAQTCPDWELILVNDGSVDGTAALIDGWANRDSRVRASHIPNRGPAVARNYGAALTRGDILCFLDADDLWFARKLADLNTLFANKEIGGTYGQVHFFTGEEKAGARSSVPQSPLSIQQLMAENPVCTMSNFALRRVEFERIGGLSQGFIHNEDLEWLIRLVGHGLRIQPIDQPHVWYRRSNGGLSADLSAMAKSRRQALDTARKFGFHPSPQDEATYLRYLARRALRLEAGIATARQLTLKGLRQSPAGFLFPLRRGGATAIAALAAPLLPKSVRRALFT